MYILAQIDRETKICLAIIRTKENIESDNVVNLEVYDMTILGKKWNGTDWEEVIEQEPEEPTA
jgi:hypothetical protein